MRSTSGVDCRDPAGDRLRVVPALDAVDVGQQVSRESWVAALVDGGGLRARPPAARFPGLAMFQYADIFKCRRTGTFEDVGVP
jgi:hypothetical protein